MSRRRSKRVASKSTTKSRDYCVSTDDDNESDFENSELLNNILGLFLARQRPKRKRQPKAKKPKPQPKRSENSGAPKAICSDYPDSDLEESSKVSDTQVHNIKSKLDSFFKDVESSEDELEKKLASSQKAVSRKDQKFYSILSDCEDDSKLELANNSSFTQPSTSRSNYSEFQKITENSKASETKEKSSDDLFNLVDDILKDCDDDKSKAESASKPTLKSLEEFKKETDRILGSVSSLIKGYSAPNEPEPKKQPVEGPSCPICLELLGGDLQMMATICGHIFCQPCIVEVAKKTKKCPTCRKALTMKKIHPIFM